MMSSLPSFCARTLLVLRHEPSTGRPGDSSDSETEALPHTGSEAVNRLRIERLEESFRDTSSRTVAAVESTKILVEPSTVFGWEDPESRPEILVQHRQGQLD